ncbi:trypsin-like peptidase domain-containing protein [Streptomyces sp. NPDC049040]|uniref:effector-associated domain 2-containing protein n=1 Tax=Streptomyces sp. NPDC049040 TaxID=3365593 RepID=UPI003717FBAD
MGVLERLEDPWRVRVFGPRGPVGAGVLLTGRRVLTCAHVIDSALGEDAGLVTEGAPVTVEFPASLTGGTGTARVVPGGWAPRSGERADVAVLELDSAPPADTGPATLRRCGPAAGRQVRAYGEAGPAGQGGWARMVLVGSGGLSPDWVQMDLLTPHGERVRRGYSGAGVVDTADGSVRGILVAAAHGDGADTAWMIPVEAILRYCPLLTAAVTPEVGGRAPDPFPEWPARAEQRLVEALVRLPSIRDRQRRDSVIRDTGDDIALLTERSDVLLQDVRALVSQCLQYDDGIDRLAAAARWYERGSRPMAEFDALWLSLRPDGS